MRLDTLPLYISHLFIKRVIAEGYSDAKDGHYIDRDLREAYFKASIYSSIYKETTDEILNGTGTIARGSGARGVAKSIGFLGGSLALLDGGLTYLERKGQYGATSAAIDGVAHTGTALGSIYVGAVVGNVIPIPVVGTIAGAVAGYFVGGIANTLYDGFAHGKWNLDNFSLW